MAECACHSSDAKDCLALRYGGSPVPFGERHEAEACECLCHDEDFEDDGDDGQYPNGAYHGTEF